MLNIWCPQNMYIHVTHALYGRLDFETCKDAGDIFTANCRSPNAIKVVKGLCEDHRICVISATNDLFGDPCIGTLNYLTVAYYCQNETIWTHWSACQYACGIRGNRTRTRTTYRCSDSGMECTRHEEEETEACSPFCKRGEAIDKSLCKCPTNLFEPCCTDDPCTDHTVWYDNDGLLSAGWESREPYLCHRPLRAGWYRMRSPAGENIHNQCVDRLHCSTVNPVWINGSLPTEEGVIHSLQTFITSGYCTLPHTVDPYVTIRMKNCGDFNVFYLTQVLSCDAAYCFGKETRCPVGTSSETGFTPGCYDKFPATPGNPTLTMTTEKGDIFKDQPPRVNFVCERNISDTFSPDVTYEVEWYGTSTVYKQRDDIFIRRATGLTASHTLHDKHLPAGLNIKLWCRIRARDVRLPAPSQYSRGNSMFLGARVEPNVIRMHPKERATVKIVLTMPFLGYFAQDKLNLELYMKNNRKPMCDPQTKLVGAALDTGDFTEAACRSPVKAIVPPEPIKEQSATFTIDAAVSNLYTGRHYAMLANFKTSDEVKSHPIWSSYHPEPLQVTVIDEVEAPDGSVFDPNTRTCTSYNDPHLTTFDGCRYDMHEAGEFILYKHKTLPARIHVFTEPCYSGYPSCNCAVAIKSGSTQYFYGRCDNQPLRDDFLKCEDSNILVTTKGGERQVTLLSTGTTVTITPGGWKYINILIRPTVKDVGLIEGLCGNLDREKSNDLRFRHSETNFVSDCSSYVRKHDTKAFGESWEVPDEESMQNRNDKLDTVQPDKLCGCSCKNEDEDCTTRDLLDCNPENFQTQCKNSGWRPNRRYLSRCQVRKRRAAGGMGDDHSDLRRPPFQAQKNNLTEPTWRGGWTLERANRTCWLAIYGSTSGRACRAVPGMNLDDAVDTCILDIKMMANEDWVQNSVEAMKGKCETEVSGNFSLWTQPADNSTEASPPADIVDNLCPMECSGHGVCHQGVCNCSFGYADVDCSVNLRRPPTLDNTPGDCDLSVRPCRATPVYGGLFLDSSNLTCEVQVVELTTDGPESAGPARHLPAEFIHRQEIMCPLPWTDLSRQKRNAGLRLGQGYILRVSNDGVDFSSETGLLSYDTKCVDCNGTDCAIKEDTCLINDTCFLNHEVQPGSPCHRCESSNSQTLWTFFRGCFIDEACYVENQTNLVAPCQYCNPENVKNDWTIKANYCSINGDCQASGAQHPSLPCTSCDPAASISSWTHHPEECPSKKTTGETNLALIVGSVVATMVAVAAVVGAVLWFRFKSSPKVIPSEPERNVIDETEMKASKENHGKKDVRK